MSYIDNQSSLAIQAHCTQNLYVPNEQYPKATPDSTSFPCHDTFQNGIIENGQPTTFYTATTNADIENIKNHKSQMSGFLSDESTINSCKNSDGVFDANKYAEKSQTQPWRSPDSPRGTNYTYRENIAAFDVNWDELNNPKNADLRERLCDSNGNLKCAFGKVEKNTHWGEGGANQYYINKKDFNEGVNRGIFQYNSNKTLKASKGTLTHKDVSEADYKAMNAERKNNIDKQLSSCPDKTATTNIDKARSLNDITPEKAHQINSAQASNGKYLAKPDPAFNYNQSSSISNNNGDLSKISSTDKVADRGGANVPNNSVREDADNSFAEKNPSYKCGQNPPQEAGNSQAQESTQKGQLPEQTSKSDVSNQVSGDISKEANGEYPSQSESTANSEAQNSEESKESQNGKFGESAEQSNQGEKSSDNANSEDNANANGNGTSSVNEQMYGEQADSTQEDSNENNNAENAQEQSDNNEASAESNEESAKYGETSSNDGGSQEGESQQGVNESNDTEPSQSETSGEESSNAESGGQNTDNDTEGKNTSEEGNANAESGEEASPQGTETDQGGGEQGMDAGMDM